MRTPDQILREIREVEDQGVLLTFRKKKRIISDPRVLSGRMSVRDAAIGQIVEKEETVPEAQEQPSQPVQEMKDGGSLPDLPKYQVGTKTHPILGPIDFNDKSSGSFTKEDWDRMHKDERSRLEKFLGAKTYNELKDRPEFKGENVAEIFDGLGSSSWNDALQAHDQWHKSGRTYPTFYEGVEMFGALPMIGKAKIGFTLAKGAKGKLISAGKKIRTAADNVQKALNAADAGKDVYEEDLPSIESIQPTKPGTLSKEVKKILPKYQLRTNSFPQVTDKYGNKGTRVRLVGDIDQDTGKAYAAYAPMYSLPEATVTAKLDRTNPTAVKNWSRINDPVAYAAREATEDVANNYLYPIAEVAPGTGDVSDVMHLGKAVKDRDLTTMGIAATAAALPYVTYGALKVTRPYRDYAKRVVNDYRVGMKEAKKQGTSIMPLSRAEKKMNIKAQDEALEEGVSFTQDWFYPTQSKLTTDESGKIKKMISKHKLRETPEKKIREILDDNEGGGLKNIPSTAFNFKRKESPLFQKENILMETHTLPILSSNVSIPVKKYLLNRRGKILGVNFNDGPSITLRNQGFYRIPPNKLKETIIHETGHTSQELGYDMSKLPGFDPEKKIPVTWGQGIAHVPEGYEYAIPNPRTRSGYLAEKVMVDPVKGKNYNWSASPLEVHSELMPLRERMVSTMVKKGWEYDDAIEWLQRNEATRPDILEYYRKSLSNFWKPGADPVLIDAFLKTLPAVGGIGVGLKAMNEKEKDQIQ